ncbi:MAG: Secretion system C-terminal sorting domain [Bacteroidota bacterium]|jgi:hypothetical protein
MRKLISLVVFASLLLSKDAQAQIENVIVETYYISNADDATDTTGGGLAEGSKTYRIYLDLQPGVILKKVYGDVNHPLVFTSTENFFNNKVDGQSFGKDFTKNRLTENTVALDSWITLGQTTRVSSKTTFGVLKSNDDDGSFIGGVNSDGGSALISNGLLTNTAAELGIPLTVEDGNDTLTITPEAWADFGFKNILTGEDSTIFGSIVPSNSFESRNAYLTNSGVKGVDPSLNHVLVAQLTTLGEITFKLNIEVEVPGPTGNQLVKLVATDSSLVSGEVYSPFLSYPQQCGCADNNYLEYSPAYACNVQDSCKTLLALGCMDPLACNYDPSANFNIQEVCCYIGNCNDLDISVVCPSLLVEDLEQGGEATAHIYPNPTSGFANIKAEFNSHSEYQLELFNYSGKKVKLITGLKMNPSNPYLLDLTGLSDGIYLVRFTSEEEVINGRIIKN